MVEEIDRVLEEINPVNDSDKISLVIQRFILAEKFRSSQVDKWDKFYQYYRNYRNPKDYPWLSNLFVPVAYTVIESLLPKLISAIFAPKFVFQILPREKNDIEQAKIVEELLRYQFDQMDVYRKFYNWFKQALIYGTSILKVFWRFEICERTVTEPSYVFGLKVGSRPVTKTIIEYDGPDIEVVDLYDFFIDPRATTIKDAKWCIHRIWRDYDYLVEKQKQGYYKNIEKIKPGVGELRDIMKSVRATVTGLPTGIVETDKYKVELLEYWEDNKVITIAQRSVIIRDEDKNPFWHGRKPFIDIKDIEMPHEFYGIGEIEPIESLINERNELRNQAMDNLKTIVNKILIANRNADIDFDRLEEQNRPGGVILTDDMNALKYLEPTNIVADLYNQDAMLVKDIQDATAMAEWTIGTTPRRTETATAVMQIQQSAATRFTLKLFNFVKSGVAELVRMMIALNQQFLDKKKTVRILGDKGFEFKEISAEDISGNYDLIPNVGIMEVGKEIERQQLLLLANNPLFTLPNVNIEEFQKAILEKFDIKDVDRFIKPMEVVKAEQQREAMTQSMIEQTVKATKRQRQASGLPSIAGLPGVPVPRE